MKSWAAHENTDMERARAQREFGALACNKLLRLLCEHHPELAPPNTIKLEPAPTPSVPAQKPAPLPPAQSGALTSPESAAPSSLVWTSLTVAIIKATMSYFGISKEWLLSRRHDKKLVRPRHIAMYLAHEMTGRSLPQLGCSFGGRDHTTVLHAVRKISQKIITDAALAADVDAVRKLAIAATPALRPSMTDRPFGCPPDNVGAA